MGARNVLLVGPTLLCLALNVVTPGCSSSSSDAAPELATYRAALQAYDPAMEQVVSHLTAVAEGTQAVVVGLATDDDEFTDLGADLLAAATEKLLVAVADLERLETNLQGKATQAGMITQELVLLVGVGLAVAGTWAFGKKMKSLSDEMSAARRERDAATDAIANDEPGAVEEYTEAKAKMNDVGARAIEEVTTKVATELILSPINPTSVAGLVLKDKLGNSFQEGVKVLTATNSCRDNPSSADCVITVQRTDASGRVTIPAGPQTVLISSPSKARVSVDEIVAEVGTDHLLERELIAVAEADPDLVDANDDGTYDPSDPNIGSPNGGSPGGGTVAGTFPQDPFNGLQLSYSISGIAAGAPTDSDGFTVSRDYEGQLGSGTLTVSGTARAENGFSAALSVTATAGSNSDSDEAFLEVPSGGGLVSDSFSVSVPIPEGATSGSVAINLVGSYNTGSRAVVVSVSVGDGL